MTDNAALIHTLYDAFGRDGSSTALNGITRQSTAVGWIRPCPNRALFHPSVSTVEFPTSKDSSMKSPDGVPSAINITPRPIGSSPLTMPASNSSISILKFR